MTREEIEADMAVVRQADAGAIHATAAVVDAARLRLREAGFPKVTSAAEHEEIGNRMGVTDGPTAPYWVRSTRVFPTVTKAAAKAFIASSTNERARVWPKAKGK